MQSDRISPIRAVASAAAAIVAAICISCGGGTPATKKRDVILIVMDTTRADHCTTHGYGRPTTPRLAEFAADAVTFRDAWSPACWTGPAHASLFTGLSPRTHRFEREDVTALDQGVTTLAEALAAAGWRTASFSNNPFVTKDFGTAQGFERVDDLWRDEKRAYPWAPATHDLAFAWFMEQRTKGEPAFLFINDMEPHAPYTPPADHQARFLPTDVTPGAAARARAFEYPQTLGAMVGAVPMTDSLRANVTDLYDAEIATVDDAVGKLLDRLRAAGALENAVVVIAADHGENLGDHGMWEHHFSLHRSVLRVPLVIRCAGVFQGGRVVDDVVRLEDVMPTVLELCGVAAPAGLDGRTLTRDTGGRVALGWQSAQGKRLDRVTELFPGRDAKPLGAGISSAYDGRHHLIRWDDGREALFDVRSDPGETKDLAASTDPDVVAAKKRLAAALQ